MVAVPEETPVIIPVPDPAVATDVLLLLHDPPVVASVSLVVNPAQTIAVPAMAAGGAFTFSALPAVVSFNPELVQESIQR